MYEISSGSHRNEEGLATSVFFLSGQLTRALQVVVEALGELGRLAEVIAGCFRLELCGEKQGSLVAL